MNDPEYHIVYSPPAFNFMDRFGKITHPLDLLTFMCGRDARSLNADNALDFLRFDPARQRKGMAETLAMECYTLEYVANIIARCAPRSQVILSDGKRRTPEQVIACRGKKPAAFFMTAMSANFPTAVAVALVLNHLRIPVILGGIHVSSSPDDVQTYIRAHAPHPELIAQVIGPADRRTMERVLADLPDGKPAATYRGETILEDGLWGNSNVVPMPSLRLDALRRIPAIGGVLARRFRVNVTTPYIGCPYNCSFCSISTLPKAQRGFAARQPEDFINELAHRQKNGINAQNRFFFFLPDNLLLGGRRLEEILDRIIAGRMEINFAAQISIEVANNPRLLRKLRQAGATHFFIGLESLDLRNLAYVGKHIAGEIKREGGSVRAYYKRRLKRIQNEGISVHGSFIFGLPYDYFRGPDDHTGTAVADFCIDNHIGLQPCAFTDLPGSLNYRESQASGNYLYGRQGTFDYLAGLCISDLSETNRVPFDALKKSSFLISYMAYEAIRRVGATPTVMKNAALALAGAMRHPTRNGAVSLKGRLEDGLYAMAAQLCVGLYKDHADMLAYSRNGIQGTFERLYRREQDPQLKQIFSEWVRAFQERNTAGDRDCAPLLPTLTHPEDCSIIHG